MPQGALALYRRHLKGCAHLVKGNAWTRCQCPIWVQGSIGGEAVRRSLNTTNWTAASTTVHQWQSSGQVGVLKPELPAIDGAIEKFLEEAKTRNLAATTIKKRRELLEGKLLAYCKRKGLPASPGPDRRAPARLPTRMEILAAVSGKATGVLARLLPVLRGGRLDGAKPGRRAQADEDFSSADAALFGR
jgi:hypothetical protein